MSGPAGAAAELQREVTRTALAAVSGRGFALAGSGAIREHGIVDRATRDVDLFTDQPDVVEFGFALENVVGALRNHGLMVDEIRRAPQYAQLRVRTEQDPIRGS